jgi:DNA-binding CsgD family transcriptional regulator
VDSDSIRVPERPDRTEVAEHQADESLTGRELEVLRSVAAGI